MNVILCRWARYFSECMLFFKQKTAYEMRISDWSSDVCSSDLDAELAAAGEQNQGGAKTLHVLLHFSHCCGATAALLSVLKPLPVMPLSDRLAIAKAPIPLQARLTSPFKPPIFV